MSNRNLVTNLYSIQRHHERTLRSKQQQIKQLFYGRRINQQQAQQYLKQLNKEYYKLELLNKFIHKMSYKTKRRNNYNRNNYNAYPSRY